MPKEIEGKNGGKLIIWERGESGNPNGRPRRVLKKLEDEIGISFNISLSKEDKFEVLESMLELNTKQLDSIIKDDETPAFMVIIAKGLKNDMKTGRTFTLSECLDRFFGKPKQTNHTDMSVNVLNNDKESLRKAIKKLSNNE